MAFSVTIDSREPKWIKDWLPRTFPKLKFDISKLEEGDFCSEHVIVERKTIADLWGSIMGSKTEDGRLEAQLSRLTTHQSDKIVIIMITGDVDEWLGKMRRLHILVDEDIIDGMIASLIVRDNIRVICGAHEKSCLKRMIRIMWKIEVEHSLDFPKLRNPDMLMARILDISKNDWFAIKETYGTSVSYLCKLTEKDFGKVSGIGKVKSKRIVEILQHGW